jgi:ATP-dependent Clp protease ATP-binding subunit ClpA
MLSLQLQVTLNAAIREAQVRRHEYVTLEHVLFALLFDEQSRDVLRHAGADLERLERELRRYFENEVQSDAGLPSGHEPAPTPGFRRVLQRAILHVRSSGKKEATGGDVLIAMFQERKSHAVALLEAQDVTRLDIMEYVSHGISKVGPDQGKNTPGTDQPAETAEEGRPTRDPLGLYCTELVAKAAAGKLDAVIGREAEIARTIHVLSRRRKNNPVFVGEPGVGKTTLVEGLAQRIHAGGVPDDLKGATIFQLDIGALLAGTRYRGDFEERIKAVVAELKKRPKAILFIDEIHNVIGAGATTGGTMDAGNLLKPVLNAGELRCIGSTTYEELKQLEKDRALARRFQKIDVPEPTPQECRLILDGLAPRYAQHHGLAYEPEALQACVDLAVRHLHGRHLPDSAIDLMDEAGAAERLKPEGERKELVTPKDVEAVVARMARIPVEDATANERVRLKSLAADLGRVVFGQDGAIGTLVQAVKRSRAGLNRPGKPVGSFLFVGPTGVGKTELARQLAIQLGLHFERFDMSEFMEKHAVSRLIGAPPGYVGFDQGGLLVDAIRKHPHSIVLLDEIEKAHADLFNILLQVMDHAELTDNNGKKADFRHVVLIMTSNLGAREMSGKSVGFTEVDRSAEGGKAVERAFAPEFRNRLDAVVRFVPLARETMLSIVDKFIAELESQLREKHVSVVLTDAARAHLAEKGHDRVFGARPLARLVQERVKDPLTDELLFGALQSGGEVLVDLEGEKLTFRCTPRAKAPVPEREKA